MNFYTLLKLHQRIKSRRIKLLGLYFASLLGMRFLSIRIDPVMGCNLSCKMCSFSSPDFRKNNKGSLKTEDLEFFARTFFPRAFQLVVGCAAEPTLHKDYLLLLHLAQKYKVPDVELVTNGQLLEKDDLFKIRETGINEIILSSHGVTKATYENYMRGASYERFHALLNDISLIRDDTLEKRLPELRINYTVNRDNLDELNHFFEVYGNYSITTLQVRPVMDMGGEYREQITDALVPKYNQIISALREECRQRNVRLLGNKVDVLYKEENTDGDLAELVYLYISPSTISKMGLERGNFNFRQFMKADKWLKRWRNAFGGGGKGNDGLKRSLKYEEL